MRKELATSEAASAISKTEMEATLTQMKFVVVDVTLHIRAELMEEFKVIYHVDWDLDLENKF